MKRKTLEQIMISTYTDMFRETLMSAFHDDRELSSDFHMTSANYQKEIEKEVNAKSAEMAHALVQKLKGMGLLEKEPSKEELKQVICEVLSEYGVEK